MCTSCETHASPYVWHHSCLMWMCCCNRNNTTQRGDVIPLQNLFILPGWNGCCQDNPASYLSFLRSVVFPWLISLNSILDGAPLCSSLHLFKWSQIVHLLRIPSSFHFILVQLKEIRPVCMSIRYTRECRGALRGVWPSIWIMLYILPFFLF